MVCVPALFLLPLVLLPFSRLISVSVCQDTSNFVRTPSDPLPDPSHVADPSLLPVHLQKPDYRPLSGATERKNGGPKAAMDGDNREKASETIMNMGEGQHGTTEKLQEVEEKAKAEESAKEAEESAKEAEEKAKAEESAKETEESAKEAEEKAKAEESAKEAEEKAKDIVEKQEEEAKVAPLAADESFSGDSLRVLMDALRSAKLLVQNITLVVPSGKSASLGVLLNALVGGRSVAPSPDVGLFLPQSTLEAAPPPNSLARLALSPPPEAPASSPGTAGPLFDPSLAPIPSFSNCRPISAPQAPFFRPPPAVPLAVPSPITQPHANFLVDVEQLHGWIKSGRNVKVIDASYETDPGTTDHVQFYAEYYANWDKLMAEKKGRQYARAHIPGAVPFNVNIATFPSWNERQALYPPDKFEQYVQRLGIDSGDRLVIYARGPLGGLLHAARVWFLLRIYGHEEVFVLDGGLDAWRKADLPANDAEVETELGNWKAHFRPELLVTFEQLTTAESDGFCVLSRLNWFNFLDARPRNEFFGLIGPQPFGPQRNRLSGSKPFPADELVQDGFLAPPIEIIRKLQQIGYSRGYQTIAMGNTADEASLALLALGQVQDTRAKLFNGGMEELRRRAPSLLISKN